MIECRNDEKTNKTNHFVCTSGLSIRKWMKGKWISGSPRNYKKNKSGKTTNRSVQNNHYSTKYYKEKRKGIRYDRNNRSKKHS